MFEKRMTYSIVTAVAALNLMLYLSMRSMLSFIGAMTFAALPYLLGVLMATVLVTSLVLLLVKQNKKLLIACFSLDALFFVFILVYFCLVPTHFKSYLSELWRILLVYLAIAIILYLVFFFPKAKFSGKKAVAIPLASVLVFLFVMAFTDLGNLTFNWNTEGAAVYVVGEEYQIVWTTKEKGMAWVEVGGKSYYDEYAGKKRTSDNVHKVIVPQTALDNAKGYTVYSKAMINEEAYAGLQGYTVKKSYAFRPIDETDGIQSYTVTDTHDYNKIAKKTASYFGDKLDFLILAGDHVSFLNTTEDLQRILNLAHGLTEGEIPVLFVRGNHESKGKLAERLHRYVGTDGDGFYYTFRLGSVWGLTLDLMELKTDDWHEFYGTASYDAHRAEQIVFLQDVIARKGQEYEAADVTVRIGISHIPTAFIPAGGMDFYDQMFRINELVNQLNLSVMLSGHLHEIYMMEPIYAAGTELYWQQNYSGKAVTETPQEIATGAVYYQIIAGRRQRIQSHVKSESMSGRYLTGTALEFKDKELYIAFTNDKKEQVSTVGAFSGKQYAKTIILEEGEF